MKIKNTLFLLFVSFFFISGIILNCQSNSSKSPKSRLLYNSDGSNIFLKGPVPISVQQVWDAVDEVAGTQAKTFLISPNAGQNMFYPSKVGEMFGEKEYDRIVADTSISIFVRNWAVNLRNLVKQGHDPLALIVDRAREKGLEIFLTFRMNELHDVTTPGSPLLAPFWKSHLEFRLNDLPGEPWGEFALDYAIPEVRNYYFSLLKEVCENYNIDGLELDFQRFPHYFKHAPGEAWKNSPIMTEFVTSIRTMMDQIGEKKNRSLLLSVRVPSSLKACKTIGLDVVDWVKKNLLDFVTVAPFLTTEFNIPIQEFKQAFSPSAISVYTGLEFSVPGGRPMTKEVFRSISMNYLDQGADGIYLFNFFCYRETNLEPDFTVLKEIGNLKTLTGKEKLYEMVPITPFEHHVALQSPLPLTINPGETKSVNQYIADHPDSPESIQAFSNSVLRIITKGIPDGTTLNVSVNGKKLESGTIPTDSSLFHGPHYVKAAELKDCRDYLLPLSVLKYKNNEISFLVEGLKPVTINEIQIALK